MKFQKKSFIIFLCFVEVICISKLYAIKVGSNKATSRQKRIFLQAEYTSTELSGFAIFENGITLEDSTSTCTFDAFFPVSGDILLNGGTVTLLRDLQIGVPCALGVGKIDANLRSIRFPSCIYAAELPRENHDKILQQVQQEDMGQGVTSLDWSYDDKYLAVSSVAGTNELKIYYLQDQVLTLTYSQDFGSEDLHSVRWHPSDYYLALGKTNAEQLKIYYLNIPAGTLDEKDGLSPFVVNAVAWSPSGDYVAFSDNSGSSFFVSEVSGGVLGTSYAADLGASRSACQNALAWNFTGDQIAIGLESDGSNAEVKVFDFNGSSLVANGQATVNADALSVGWLAETNYLLVGLSASSERLLLFDHNSATGSLTEQTTARVGVGQKLFCLASGTSNSLVAVGKALSTDAHELELYAFDGTHIMLSLCAGRQFSTHIKALGWSNCDCYVATGGSDGSITLFKLVSNPLVFSHAKLFFDSDLRVLGDVVFQGDCIFNGGGNICEFEPNGKITVDSGASLIIENIILRGISADDICCADDTSQLILRDVVWNQDSLYTFSLGSIQFKNDVFMSGESKFVYASSQTSTVLSKSELELDLGFTFSYDPAIASKTLLEFVDETSKLTLNGATLHATPTGLLLTNGRLRILRDSTLSVETMYTYSGNNAQFVNEGITFGDGAAQNDFRCDIYSGVMLSFGDGTLNYRNANSSSWRMHSVTSTLYMYPRTWLNLYESINLGNGSVMMGDRVRIGKAENKMLSGSINPLGRYSSVKI